MIKKLLSLALIISIFGVVTTAVSAAGSEDSEATVTFQPDTTPTDPVNPEDPDAPGSGGGTGMDGPLSLDYVPTLDFGTQLITGGVETYEATDTRAFIQITDKRGTDEGWQVSAQLSDFTSTANATRTLPGAVINFGNASLATTGTNQSAAPTTGNFALTAGGSSAIVVNAPVNTGMGTWVNRWFATTLTDPTNDNVTLTVDTANALANTYEATITWTLSEAP